MQFWAYRHFDAHWWIILKFINKTSQMYCEGPINLEGSGKGYVVFK